MVVEAAPALESIVHVALTVTDVDASVAWYERILGLGKVLTTPHDGGHGVVLCSPDRRIWMALHHHDTNEGERFSPTRTGLDHVAFMVGSYADLEGWRRWLDSQDVPQSPIVDLHEFDVAALVFRDPDGIPLELISPRRPLQQTT
jgi:glyoxylase I family protein